MKINLETKNVSLKGVLATREASIKSGAHIMQILAGLYSNPLDAIVREYMTNCGDAPACGQPSGRTVTKRYITCKKCLKMFAKQKND